MELDFEHTPLGYHIRKNKNNIDKINAFWAWENDISLWRKIGRPNPFDDNDVSIYQLFKANMRGTGT